VKTYDAFGINRSIEPRGSPPQPAWKLDNTMELNPNELLVDVKIININLVSFNEIGEETKFQDERFKARIMEIISERGKLHNPVTGTGGMFYGQVLKMGDQYPNRYDVREGDKIISLMSLSATPIKLQKIISVDYESAQLEVIGQCILFENAPLIKKPEDLPLKLIVAAMDEAGAPTRTFGAVQENQDVLIMGASGKVGLLCAFAAKDKLNGTGRVVGLVKSEENKRLIEKCCVFDEIVHIDATDFTRFYEHGCAHNLAGKYDIVVNCINSPNTEMASLMAVKNKGTLYFATLSCDYKFTALTAESIGKEVSIIPYTGYIEGHANYTLGLIRRFKHLQEFLQFKKTDATHKRGTEDYCISHDKHAELSGEVGSEVGYIFNSKESNATLRQALKVTRYNSNVIIYGESGVGKEIIARIIHQNSDRKSFPLIKINCAAISEHLLESELFGYEKGSFTGASAKGKIGLWEAAQNGTLFLDEIGELPINFQAKLLRVIQEKEIVRVGGIAPIKVDVRIVAATNKNLLEMIEKQLFREDLYYRLNVFPVTVLPLRERKRDIIPLANYFVEKYNQEFGMHKTISTQGLNFLSSQPFRGNIRELQNLIQRLMIAAESQMLEVKDILNAMAFDQKQSGTAAAQDLASDAADWMIISTDETASLKELLGKTEESILRQYKKKYRSTRKIAQALQISQPSVVKKLNQYGIVDTDVR